MIARKGIIQYSKYGSIYIYGVSIGMTREECRKSLLSRFSDSVGEKGDTLFLEKINICKGGPKINVIYSMYDNVVQEIRIVTLTKNELEFRRSYSFWEKSLKKLHSQPAELMGGNQIIKYENDLHSVDLVTQFNDAIKNDKLVGYYLRINAKLLPGTPYYLNDDDNVKLSIRKIYTNKKMNSKKMEWSFIGKCFAVVVLLCLAFLWILNDRYYYIDRGRGYVFDKWKGVIERPIYKNGVW